MKIKNSIIKLLFILFMSTVSVQLFGQGAPPPPPADHGSTGNQTNGAPIGGGLFILLGLGVAYGGKKVWDMKREK